MAWVPIEESGIEFTFVPYAEFGGVATLTDSVALNDRGTPPSGGPIARWSLEFSNDDSEREPVLLRLTALSFAASGALTGFGWDGETPGQQTNESPASETSWEPSPFEATITFNGGGGVLTFTNNPFSEGAAQTSQFLIEVWEEDPVPPDEETPPYIIRGTHRAYMGVDSPQTAWIRDEAGAHDLTAYDAITVDIKGPSRDRPSLTVDATGTAGGKLQFTVPADGARKRLYPGTFNLFAKADGLVIYTGLLEVLA